MSLFFIFLTITLAQVQFVSVGDDGATGNSIAYSYTGSTWYPAANKVFSVKGNGVAYGFKWVAVGQGNNTMAYSNDGITWIPLGNTTFTVAGHCVAYGAAQGRWMAGGQGTRTLAYSMDGITWIPITTSLFTGAVYGIAYSDIVNRWVAVGYGGTSLSISSNGITWLGAGNNIFASYGKSVIYANNMFVATGKDPIGTQVWSSDASYFTGPVSHFANVSNSAAYGQGKWILTCMPLTNSTPFANSTDGKNWIAQATQTTQLNIGYGIVYSPLLNLWIAVGKGNLSSITYSSNGITWTYGTNIFNVSGYGVAAYSDTISTNVSNLVTNTVVIPPGVWIIIQQFLGVNGNLTVNGNWAIASQGSVNVNGSLNINGNTTFNTNTSNWNSTNSSIVTSELNVADGAALSIVLDASPGIGNTITIQLVSYTTPIRGTFFFNPVQALYIQDPNECLFSTPIYSSTSLSISISVVQCNSINTGVIMNNGGIVGSGGNGGGGSFIINPGSGSNNGGGSNVGGFVSGGNGSSVSTVSVIGIPDNVLYSSGGQLPTGAIVGIAIGAILIATALMVLLAYVVKIRRKKWQDAKNAELRRSAAEALKPSPGNNLHFGDM